MVQTSAQKDIEQAKSLFERIKNRSDNEKRIILAAIKGMLIVAETKKEEKGA